MCEFEWMPRAGIFCMSAVVFSCLQSIASAVVYVVPCPNSYFKIENTSQDFHSQSPESEVDRTRWRHIPRSLLQIKNKRGHT